MPVSQRLDDFHSLRKQYPWFSYESFSYGLEKDAVRMQWHFNLCDQFHFYPESRIMLRPWLSPPQIPSPEWDNLVFQTGMAEMVSYWKAACPPLIRVRPFALDAESQTWWKDLYFKGLGEFLFLNGIATDKESLVQFFCEGTHTPQMFDTPQREGYLIPLGGGKDSVVTLEMLRTTQKTIVPLIMNPRGATLNTAQAGGFQRDEILEIQRTIHPQLLRLNEAGFLNGHTPFSAVLGFYTLMAAHVSGIPSIALSNESSANESTVAGSQINHQYSKSYEYEKIFREYYTQTMSPGFRYFSFLRPLNELQIASLFARFTAYHEVFRSCNAGSREDVWCGNCPKCLFAWIILQPFIGDGRLKKIFGKNLLDDSGLSGYLDELSGHSLHKPFECVGTLAEVNAALSALLARTGEPLPLLLQRASSYPLGKEEESLKALLQEFHTPHFLNTAETDILTSNLCL